MSRHKVGRKSKNASGNPEYREHKATGQAVVTLPLGNGKRKDVYLGRFGPESKAEYNRVIAEWAANGRRVPEAQDDPARDLTINELVSRFIDHADTAYRDATTGEATSEYRDYQLSLFPLRKLFGELLGKKFGPVALEQVRDFMVRTGSGKDGTGKDGKRWNRRTGKGLCRRVVNQRLGRIRRFFKWCASKELLPASVYQVILTVEGLREGRSPARESKGVSPVPDAIVDATLPHLTRHVAAMVRVQRFTGARPGEVCAMRGIDIDRTDAVWVYRPGSDHGPHGKHKTAHKGHSRSIPIGPKGQAVLLPFLEAKANDPTAFVFSPRDCVKELRAERRAKRKSKVQPSQRDRSKPGAERLPGMWYTVDAYGKAIRKACERHGIPHWHPHQLRHTAGTIIRKSFGVEAAQTILGHANLRATELYAESNLEEAVKIAAEMG
jgi:integrase